MAMGPSIKYVMLFCKLIKIPLFDNQEHEFGKISPPKEKLAKQPLITKFLL